MPGVSYDQLMRVPQIIGVYSRLYGPTNFFQRLLKLAPTDAADTVSSQRTFGYDVYANTRTIAPATGPNSPPTRVGSKPIGTETATLYRFHPSTTIYDAKVFQTRQIGSYGLNTQVDASGKKYVALQVKHVRTMIDNAIEFMVCRMLMGGFGLKPNGDRFDLCETTDAEVMMTNTYNIPAGNKDQVSGIIGTRWDNVAAPILDDLLEIQVRAAKVSGTLPRHVICNGNTIIPLFNNTKLSAIGGTAYRIFDSITMRDVTKDGPPSSGAYQVQFRALPQFTFHVLNEGLVANEVVPNLDNQIGSEFSMLIPDGKVIIIPDPGEWCGFATGTEPIAENVMDNGRVVSGLHVWRTREIDPARFDVKFLLNYVPILPIPNAVFYANVWF